MNSNVIAITALAMVAFAANSVLCRLALGAHLIDAASFATVRVVAGAVVLAALIAPRWRGRTRAATVQLSVPAIAALGGVLLMAEDLTTRLIVASVATLGGVWIVLTRRAKSAG